MKVEDRALKFFIKDPVDVKHHVYLARDKDRVIGEMFPDEGKNSK